ncbi:transposase [Sorangium sp. So ce1036]|uniref:transposase n=1 Tax=Sorangium sp. So ce1036 TaxID=3133328 RepID=UPI003F00CFCA
MGKYPSELRERAEAYARERSRAGATPTEIATELGVHKMTADRWLAGGERVDDGALPRATRAAPDRSPQKTVKKSSLAGKRNAYEDEVIERLHEILPKAARVTLLADRGFGDQERYAHLAKLGWDYIIRFRECILAWVSPSPILATLPDATDPCL